MADLVNASELGRRLGVSEGAVRKHVRRGLYRPNRDGLFDVEHCKAAWEAGRDPDAVIKGLAGAQAVARDAAASREGLPENSLTRARAANTALQARRNRLALEREQGLLIKTEDAYRACRAVVTIVIERLDGAAAQIGPRVVGLDAVAAERVAREILHGVRAEIAGMAKAIEEVADGPS